MSLAASSIIVLIFCQLSWGKDKSLRPSITSVEQNDQTKPSRVDARTVGHKNTLYYRLSCGFGADELKVGHAYKAAETKTDQTLVIEDVRTVDGDIFSVDCDVESVVN